MIRIADMVDHVKSLCRSHEIAIRWCQRSMQSHALRECDEITIAPIKAVATYAIALHEIGHILGRHQQSNYTMVRERWAWQWAKRNALIWTPRMARCAADALQWYADHGPVDELFKRTKKIAARMADLAETIRDGKASSTDLSEFAELKDEVVGLIDKTGALGLNSSPPGGRPRRISGCSRDGVAQHSAARSSQGFLKR
jgi:hypothetical protein